MIEFGDKLTAFFMEQHFYLKEQLTDKAMVIQTSVFDRHFFGSERNNPVTSRKTTDTILPVVKFELSSRNKNLKMCIYCGKPDSIPILKTFLMSSVMVLTNVFFCVLYNEMC